MDDKQELRKIKKLFFWNKPCAGGHHPRSFYMNYILNGKSFEPWTEEVKCSLNFA